MSSLHSHLTSDLKEKRFYDIDVLRFIAAVSVMAMHYLLRGFANDGNLSPVFYGDIAHAVKYNYLAVNLFFMISGFVILMSAENSNAKAFVKSRFLRLYPAYWFCCTVSFVLSTIFISQIFKLSVARYLLNLTMFNGFFNIGNIDGVYWTLFVELRFYFLILIVLLFNKIEKIDAFLLVWLLISASQIFLKSELVGRYLITDYACFFIAGCMFYRISKAGFTFIRFGILISTFPVNDFYAMDDLIGRRLSHRGIEYSDITVALICACFYLIFFLVIRRDNVSMKYARISKLLGKLSYPLYLIHFNVGMVIYNLIGNKIDKWLLFILVTTSMVIVAYAINKFIERPFSEYLRTRISNGAFYSRKLNV